MNNRRETRCPTVKIAIRFGILNFGIIILSATPCLLNGEMLTGVGAFRRWSLMALVREIQVDSYLIA